MDAGDSWNGLLIGEARAASCCCSRKRGPSTSSIEVSDVALVSLQLDQYLDIFAPARLALEFFHAFLQLFGQVQAAVRSQSNPIDLGMGSNVSDVPSLVWLYAVTKAQQLFELFANGSLKS